MMNKDMQAYHKYITTNNGISRETWGGIEKLERGEGSFEGRRLKINNRGLKEVIIKLKSCWINEFSDWLEQHLTP